MKHESNTDRCAAVRRANKFAALMICVALANLVWLGCGVKSVPIAPEAARPAKILNLEGSSSNNGIRLDLESARKLCGRPEDARSRRLHHQTAPTGDAPISKIGEVLVSDQGVSRSSHLYLLRIRRPSLAASTAIR